jgi:hypothetical protein
MKRRWVGIISVSLATGCGARSLVGLEGLPLETQGGDGGAGGGSGGVPNPGTSSQVTVAFNNVSPNNTPERATPLGVASGPQVIPWISSNQIGGPGNDWNYFVFESNSSAGQFEFNMCFFPPITGMTASLWQVQNGFMQEPALGTWTITNTCGTSFTTALDASAVYLFGVHATGDPGMYTA